MSDEELLRALAEAVAKQRDYAGFYDWPDERQKDLGLLEAFQEGASRIGLVISSSRLQDEYKDPPDAWLMHEGISVAVEFTEFVDQSLIQARKATGTFQWRSWTREEVAQKLQQIIGRKDHAGFGKNSTYWLIIHCDEPALNLATMSPLLENIPVLQVRGIDRCFMLLSYEPEIQSYPVIELSVRRAA